jgi:hypothetical protein
MTTQAASPIRNCASGLSDMFPLVFGRRVKIWG